MRRCTYLLFLGAVCGLWAPRAAATEPITEQQFQDLQKLVKPHPGESPWQEIPWITDLWEARKKAAAEGKPMFVWSASGEPQGLT
jgi:hypothetical protein